MDNESKKDFLDSLQKVMKLTENNAYWCLYQDMTSACFQKCFNKKVGKIHPGCFDACYGKYLLTMREVYSGLRDIGYRRQSDYAYKAFPESDEWFDLIYSSTISAIGPREGIFIEKEYMRNERQRWSMFLFYFGQMYYYLFCVYIKWSADYTDSCTKRQETLSVC